MKTALILGLSWWLLVSAHALTADRFELHAVASAANEHTREYLTAVDMEMPAQKVQLDQAVLLDGTAVRTLTFIPAHDGTPLYLRVEFTPEGRQRFGELTTRYLHRQLGVMVDGRLIMAPVIQTPIYGGTINAGKDPHEFPYPNFWLPFLHPENASPSPASPGAKQP